MTVLRTTLLKAEIKKILRNGSHLLFKYKTGMTDKTVRKLASSPTMINRSRAKLHVRKLGMLDQIHKDWLVWTN